MSMSACLSNAEQNKTPSNLANIKTLWQTGLLAISVSRATFSK